MNRYETPQALCHDAHSLADDARALLEATAELTDTQIAEARRRLSAALENGKGVYAGLQDRVVRGANVADEAVHQHPYQGMAAALGLGALLGYLLHRRG